MLGRKAGRIAVLAIGLVLAQGLASPSLAKRVALVIGNSSYEHAAALANPLNDAADIAATLQDMGFAITRLSDADEAAMQQGLIDFAQEADGAEVALFFYAGHGLQVDGRNYLLPVDAQLTSKAALRFRTVSLDEVLAVMEGAKVRLALLDACRDNPLVAANRSLGAGRGLAPVETSGTSGTLIAFATAPGDVAADGRGRNSPFTEALLTYLPTPGEDIRTVFGLVRERVEETTKRKQTPWVNEAISGRLVLVTAPQGGSAAAAASTVDDRRLELAFWESVKDSEDWRDFEDYLERYGDGGTFAGLAERRRDRLKQRDEAGAAAGSQQQEAESQPEEQEGAPAVEASQSAALPDASPEAEARAAEAALSLSRRDRRLVQRALNDLGHEAGVVDGLFGRRSRAALAAWQSASGVADSGFLTSDQAKQLMARGQEIERQETERAEELQAGADQTGSTVVATASEPDKALPPACQEGKEAALRSEVDLVIELQSLCLQSAPLNAKQKAIAYYHRGWAYNAKGITDLALSDFNNAIDLYSGNMLAYSYRGSIFYNKGQYDRAISDFNRMIALEPNEAWGYNSRGVTFNAMGLYDRAVKEFNKAIELDPDIVNFYSSRGYSYQKLGLIDIAFTDYNKAISMDPSFWIAYENRGRLYKEQGYENLAADDLARARDLKNR